LIFFHRILKYDGNEVYIAFDTKTTNPYFYYKQVCKILEYKNSSDTLKRHVSQKNIFELKIIVSNYKILYEIYKRSWSL
jgi:hypothetical protein